MSTVDEDVARVDARAELERATLIEDLAPVLRGMPVGAFHEVAADLRSVDASVAAATALVDLLAANGVKLEVLPPPDEPAGPVEPAVKATSGPDAKSGPEAKSTTH